MDQSTSALSNRTMGAFPVSIGTSLALESLSAGTQAPYDPDRLIPQQVKMAEYNEFWVNILSLYRNIVGAVESAAWHQVTPGDLVDTLEFEIELIKRLITDLTFGKTKVVFYSSNYRGLGYKYPHAKLRIDSTPNQKNYTQTMQVVLNGYFKSQAQSPDLQVFDLELRPKGKPRALILTHYAYDLLSHPAFNELNLIESHTGVRKEHSLFYTKLMNGKDLMRMPFNEATMQIFGDSQTFLPFSLKIRQQVISLANERKWTTLTSLERMRLSFSLMEDKATGQLLLELLKGV